MLFGRFYIKNYRAYYNSYFPLKVKRPFNGKNIFIHEQRLPLELEFLMKFQNPITQRKFKSDE